ncbi:MAG: hypothetical protein M1468_03575 [Candidatus Thermoplasmatota archaeon]|jgi:hypothetical protein|nr:hypothetical protein [Candidatus Thermoplasmatota archaeon]
MGKRRFGKDDLEEVGSYDELEKTIFGDDENRRKRSSGNNSRAIPRK